MSENFVHGAQYVVLVCLGHRGKERQSDEASLDGLGHRAEPLGVAESLSVVGVLVDQRVVDGRPDVLGSQGLDDGIAVDGEAIEPEEDDEQVPGMPKSLPKSRELDIRRAIEALAIAERKQISSLPEAVELGELRETESGLEVSQPVGVPGLADLVTPGTLRVRRAYPVVAHGAQSFGEIIPGCDQLRRMKRQRRHVGEGPDRPALEGAPQ